MLTVDDLGVALEELKRLQKMFDATIALPECEFKKALLKEIQLKLNRESVASTEKAEANPIKRLVTDPINKGYVPIPGKDLPGFGSYGGD